MAKKKASAKSTKKSHGELFDKHNNLIWLLPIFFVIAAVAVIVLKNDSLTGGSSNDSAAVQTQVTNSTTNATDSGSSLGY